MKRNSEDQGRKQVSRATSEVAGTPAAPTSSTRLTSGKRTRKTVIALNGQEDGWTEEDTLLITNPSLSEEMHKKISTLAVPPPPPGTWRISIPPGGLPPGLRPWTIKETKMVKFTIITEAVTVKHYKDNRPQA